MALILSQWVRVWLMDDYPVLFPNHVTNDTEEAL